MEWDRRPRERTGERGDREEGAGRGAGGYSEVKGLPSMSRMAGASRSVRWPVTGWACKGTLSTAVGHLSLDRARAARKGGKSPHCLMRPPTARTSANARRPRWGCVACAACSGVRACVRASVEHARRKSDARHAPAAQHQAGSAHALHATSHMRGRDCDVWSRCGANAIVIAMPEGDRTISIAHTRLALECTSISRTSNAQK